MYEFPLVDKLKDLVKTYHVYKTFDKTLAETLLTQINDLRLQIALDADIRQIYYSQLPVPANAGGGKRDIFFTRGDTRFTVNRGIAYLAQTDTISLLHQGKRTNVITRTDVAWQQLFSQTQLAAAIRGQQLAFDFPEEIYFQNNETLDIGVTSTAAGNIILHGCNLKDDYTPDGDNIKAEINKRDEYGNPSLPEWQVIPLIFSFASVVAGTEAVGANGRNEIYSVKSDKSVILTHVSISNQNCRVSLFDDGRSQEICERVEASGFAANESSPYTTYYPLPYPHLLRKQDRLKMRALNVSFITGAAGSAVPINTPVYLTFWGHTV